MTEIVSFGEWVQKRRNQLGLSRSGLAQQVGCSPVTIKKIERDERRPSTQIAELLAQHLQIPESEQENFIRRARGEFVPHFGAPEEISLAEAQVAVVDASVHNLPLQTTPFFGREEEIAQIAAKLADSNCRLLTILGAGGMGKTRLGIEVAHAQLNNFTDGITYVSLAAIGAEQMAESLNPLAGALADALKIAFHGGDTPEKQLFRYLQRKEMLLVFDNFEHLLETADFLAQLLHHAPDIKMLITSRERLQLQEEWLFPLQGLLFTEDVAVPNPATQQSAIQLFSQRAQQIQPAFDLAREWAAVLQICQLVEGMPLGLELAAAWVRKLSCAAIAQEIEAELDFLTTRLRNVPERHRSVRAVFAYSWQQLSQKEQVVLPKLSVFRGGFEREAAQAVAGASLMLLSGLVDKSLLSVGEDGRYHLHELLRQFAAEKLTDLADEPGVRAFHGRYFLTFLAEQEPRLKGPEGVAALQAIERDIDNVRTAVRWAVSHQPHLFNRAVGVALWIFYELRGWFMEGEALFHLIATKLKAACDASDSEQSATVVSPPCLHWAQYQGKLCALQYRLGRLKEAKETIQQTLSRLPAADPHTQWTRGWGLFALGTLAYFKGEHARAKIHLPEAGELLKAQGDFWSYAWSLIAHSQSRRLIGDYERAQRLVEEAERILSTMGEQLVIGYVLSELGRLAAHRGELAQAETYHKAALVQRTKGGTRTGIVLTQSDLGLVNRLQGNYEAAQSYYLQSVATATEINMLGFVSDYLWKLGNLAVAKGDYTTAKHYFQESGHGVNRVGGPGWAALGLGEFAEAKQLFRVSLQAMRDSGAKPVGLDALVGMAHLQAQSGQFRQALECLTLVRHHPASDWEIKEKVRKLWEELVAELSPQLVSEAEARGREMDLYETAESLVAESGDT